MVLLSLGSGALIALLRTADRTQDPRPEPAWPFTPPDGSASEAESEVAEYFPPFLQPSN